MIATFIDERREEYEIEPTFRICQSAHPLTTIAPQRDAIARPSSARATATVL